MITVETLKEYGADVNQGLTRCAGNEALYLRLVQMILTELSSETLGDALQNGDLEKAFEAAHKLKGGVCNLALTPIADPLCELTELLRNKTPGNYGALYSRIVDKTKELSSL